MPVALRPETETRLQEEAERQGQDADSLLNALLDSAAQERDAEIAGVRRGLADVAAGRTRSMEEFFAEHRQRHPTPVDDELPSEAS